MIFSIALRYDPCEVWLESPPDEDNPELTTMTWPDGSTADDTTIWEVSIETEFFKPGELFNDDMFVEKLE